MKRAIAIALSICVCASSTIIAQIDTTQPVGSVPQRHVAATPSVTDFRSVGETRLWTFFARQQRTSFGQLVSVVKEQTEIDGRAAVVLTQKLDIDYSKIGTDRKVAVSGETRLSLDGFYLGTKYTIGTGDSAESIEVGYGENGVSGFYTRAGNQIEVNVPLGRDFFAWDHNFADEMEIWLARQELNVGDSLRDSIYVPQTMLTTRLRGYVKWFMWREIYQGKFDSVYVISITEPQVYQAFFTPDKRLVRLDLADENIRMYQDLVRKPRIEAGEQAAGTVQSAFSPRLVLFRLPHYVAYLVVGLGTVLFLSRAGFKWIDSYLALAAGAVGFALILVTQLPLQKLIVSALVAPRVTEGGSLYGWGLLPPLVAGVFQELIQLGVLWAILFWRRPKGYRFATIGGFLGAGFGIVEAGYILGASVLPLFGWHLLERSFVIVFHVAAGALLGHAVARGKSALMVVLPLLILANSAIRYLPVFVQQGDFDLGLMHFVLAFLSLGFLAISLIGLHKAHGQEP
jgi:hypothetical protein